MEGTYNLSSTVNSENSWTSATKAIWYHSQKKIWLIGSKEKIGGKIGGVYAARIPGTGPHNADNLWHYHYKSWKTDNDKDIVLRCINANGGSGDENIRSPLISGPVPGKFSS